MDSIENALEILAKQYETCEAVKADLMPLKSPKKLSSDTLNSFLGRVFSVPGHLRLIGKSHQQITETTAALGLQSHACVGES